MTVWVVSLVPGSCCSCLGRVARVSVVSLVSGSCLGRVWFVSLMSGSCRSCLGRVWVVSGSCIVLDMTMIDDREDGGYHGDLLEV